MIDVLSEWDFLSLTNQILSMRIINNGCSAKVQRMKLDVLGSERVSCKKNDESVTKGLPINVTTMI